jgi:acetylornithine deacetylase/succinyl-diaminopimelate desuccinylase-like protein
MDLSDRELAELVELLRALVRIKSVNPPGDEILAARFVEQVLADEGLQPTVTEPFPGRGSIVARLRGDGTGGDPLLRRPADPLNLDQEMWDLVRIPAALG